MFFIKIKIKGYLKNITENTEEIIDTYAVKNKNIISYIIDNTKHKIEINPNKITLIRENKELIHHMIFELNKELTTNYYIKELKSELSIKILTTKLEITDSIIKINYKVLDNDDEYTYVIEMSEK